MRSWIGCVALPLLLAAPLEAAAQMVTEGDGAAALGVALRRLGTTKRVLMVAAHPDDENTALLAELALGDGADVAYLSLTRGEGGQNLIGPELQEGLGLIRTEELLAARRLDGARQFFTRAYDYGYSKSAEEAFAQWPADSLLADVVWVIRRYRPDVVVSVFSGTPADGHGQHQAAGILAREAFAAAGDAMRFPGQLRAGLLPHAPAYLFQALWRPPAEPRLVMATGEYDVLFGRSRYQIAMQSRSRHRSQDMGRAEPIGPQATALGIIAGDFPSGGASMFAGLDTTLSQHARRSAAPAAVVDSLRAYESAVTGIRSAYNPLRGGALTTPLSRAVRLLDMVAGELRDARYARLRSLVATEREQAAAALLLDAGVVIDVVADTPAPVPGTSFELEATVWNGGRTPVRVTDLAPSLPAGWTVAGDRPHDPAVPPDSVLRLTWQIHVPASAERTEPYFLRSPRGAAVYSWDGVPDTVRTLPFEPSGVGVAATIHVGVAIPVRRPAEYVAIDKAVGEMRRPLLVVPAASVHVEPRVAVVPVGSGASRAVAVTVRAARDDMHGIVRLAVPAGWKVEPASFDVMLPRAGDSRTVSFAVTPPANGTGEHLFRASFESGGNTFRAGHELIDYPHIRPHALYRDAVARAVVFPVSIARGLTVGYIEGAGDDGAAALRELGVTVVPLGPGDLAGDLSRFNAIVAGIRAYEVRPDLIAHNDRLLDYARAGGTFVVQYNKYELVDGGFMPYPATMTRPHGRVTDENARVELLDRTHPLLTSPNVITAADFDGWVQERGLYFLDTFDSRYTALLSMHDPGEPPLTGALVAARVGQGWYVYTGLSLFRQLPEAVPGAYRLLANLVSLGSRSIVP